MGGNSLVPELTKGLTLRRIESAFVNISKKLKQGGGVLKIEKSAFIFSFDNLYQEVPAEDYLEPS